MFSLIIKLIGLLFGLGAGIIWIQYRRKDAFSRKEIWVKYAFYLLVVWSTVVLIQIDYAYYLILGLLMIGLYEILRIGLPTLKPFSLLWSVWLYVLLAWSCLDFVDKQTKENLLWIYCLVFSFDGFSQLMGRWIGGAKLVPRISPQKTWSGLLMGLLLSASFGLWLMLQGQSWHWTMLIQALGICLVAFCGDVLASYFKRKCQVKDYASWIPGHGGILDRYDSFLFCLALGPLFTW